MKPIATVLAAMALAAGAAFVQPAAAQTTAPPMVPALLAELSKHQADEQRIARDLATFDALDFDVFTNQKWDRLHESHAKDIVVHWPDGRRTVGLEPHIADLKAMFVYAPDTRIRTHPVRFGRGEWTAVIGVIEGTFTKPMPAGEGKTLAPTGKPFKLTMATVGRWKDGVMTEEFLFWDNLAFMQQIGLAQ